MFARPGFARDNRSGAASSGDLPIIHEEASQDIQGGLPGEHYHTSKALYEALVNLINGGYPFLEPVMSLTGELMVAPDGDFVFIQRNSGAVGVGDVITPPGPVPAPSPSDPHDTYWNQVVMYVEVTKVTGSLLPTWLLAGDQYHSGPNDYGWIGAETAPIEGNDIIQWWGKNTVHHSIPPTTTFLEKFGFGTMKQSGGSAAHLVANFTLEQILYLEAAGIQYLLVGVGTSVEGMFLRYDGGTGNLDILRYTSGSPSIIATLPYALTNDVPHMFVMERSTTTLRVYIDGIVVITVTVPVIVYSSFITQAHGYGPLRITKGIARFDGVPYDYTIPWIIG